MTTSIVIVKINKNKSTISVLTFRGVEPEVFAVRVVQEESSQEVEHIVDDGTTMHQVAQCRSL